jgi:L-alanine-DL-glutamate epimerase-like enolase superfamily enzyme
MLEDDCLAQPFTAKNGKYKLPSTPGLGVSPDERALDKYRTA